MSFPKIWKDSMKISIKRRVDHSNSEWQQKAYACVEESELFRREKGYAADEKAKAAEKGSRTLSAQRESGNEDIQEPSKLMEKTPGKLKEEKAQRRNSHTC